MSRRTSQPLPRLPKIIIFDNMPDEDLRPVYWVGSSYKDWTAFPAEVQDGMGYALHLVQTGKTPTNAKPLRGLETGVLELIEDHDGDTYRCVYTIRFPEAVYVLHAFRKKSKRGVSTPKQDIALIKARLKRAEEAHAQAQDQA